MSAAGPLPERPGHFPHGEGGPSPRALVLGARGMLAHELVPQLERARWLVIGADLPECDITDPAAVDATLARARPDVVFNCAAYTAVDRAEAEASVAFRVNATGAGNVAAACARHHASCVYLSTDYAFDGRLHRPYTEEDAVSPLGAYARSKVEGERAVMASGARWYVVRTGELYGANGDHFFRAVFARARAGKPLRIVADQVVSPTWTRELALQLITIVEEAPPGLYHATCSGEVSWHAAACLAFQLAGLAPSVTPVTTAEYGSPTPRPPYTALSHGKLERLGLYRMRSWEAALRAWLAEGTP